MLTDIRFHNRHFRNSLRFLVVSLIHHYPKIYEFDFLQYKSFVR